MELAVFEMARLAARDRFRKMLKDDNIEIVNMLFSPKVNADTEDYAAQDVIYVVYRHLEKEAWYDKEAKE